MALTLLFCEFKDNGKINNGIIIYQRKENDFIIYIYCLEKTWTLRMKRMY